MSASPVSRLIVTVGLAFFSLSAGAQTATSAVGQLPLTPEDLDDPVTPQEEHLRRVERAQTIEALDENLFGDSINAYTGSLQFSVTDVAIPGNNSLAVEVRRRFNVNNARSSGARARSGHVFEDWDLDVPHMHGVFAATIGWQAGPTPNLRCAQPNLAQAAPPAVGNIQPDDYWQGNLLYVPGQGDDEIMHLAASAPDRPTDGLGYQWVTKGLWYFSCLSTTANGVPGDAFLARDPGGNKYWFNQIIEKLYQPLIKGTSTALARREVIILPTRIEDRFGNWVNYTYSTTVPRNLLIIEASDGRRIDITYDTASGGPGGRISSVTTSGRTWTYGYTGGVIGGTLATATRPDSSSYTYGFGTFHEDHVDVSYDGCGVPPQFVYAPDFVAQITHPSGAQGTFTFNYRQHGRTYVPQNCWTDGPDSGDRYPPVFTSLSVTRKQISGTGLPAALQWQWSYPALAWGYTSTCTPSCPTTKIIDVTRPDGSLIRETYGVRYGQNDGLMVTAEVRTGATSLRSTSSDYRVDPTGQLYIQRVGDPIRLYADASIGVFKPGIGQTTTQQGATFAWTVNNTSGVYSFDRFARPLQTTSSSSLGFTAARTQSYFDQLQLWVLGQSATKVTNGVTESQVDYFAATALPQHEYRFGQKTRSMTYRADSTIETTTDNLAKVTTLASWKRGLPQSVTFDDAVTRSALVDDNGWVTSVTNEVGGTTSYGYDGLGRIASIVYPIDPNNTWASTSRTFARSTAPEYGLPTGTWKQTISTGALRKHVWFDVLWRPILEREWDNSNPSGTQRFVRRTFDYRGNETFKSYPSASIATINDLSAGRTRTFDALNRLVTEQAPTELGTSTTSYGYVAPFETRVTGPRNFETRLRYFGLNEPSMEYPVRVERGINGPASEQSLTVVTRDIWGKVLSMERSGNGTTATRTLLYDTQQRLCQLTEPESGALVMEYDLGGNVAWTAEGRTPAGTCTAARSGVPVSAQLTRTYDRRNRLTHINYPDSPSIPTSDLVMTYAGDGAVLTSSMGNVTWTYMYNSLRRVESEEMAFDFRTYFADWQYDTHGAISGLIYPNGEAVTFVPNALGQQTRSGTFVTGATYHPNGAGAGWTFGNGIVRSMTQTLRKLPDLVRDVGGAVILDEDYNYDAGANVTSVVDVRDSLQSRTLTYDAQDRVSTAVGPWGSGALTYDGADNLKTQVLGAKNYTYNYGQQKLQTVTNGAQTLISFQYDARGNQTQKNAQALTWDIANRVAIAPGKARYRYDSQGRRVLIEKLTPAGAATGERTVQFYSKEGVLLYEERNGVTIPELGLIFSNGFEVYGVPPSEPVDKATYHYLGRTLVARKDTANNQVSTTYVHTDALGSVMAETNQSQVVTRRVNYQPFGLPGGSVVDGPNYTGHVFDTATSLLYMQGRYYDPDVGRFLSMDPAAPSAIDGADFNRYAYARNNPYTFVDPDGREAVFSFSNGATFWDAVSTVRYLMRSPTARSEFRQLTDSKQTYRLAFDRGKDSVMSYDHDTRTVTINPTSGLRVGAKGEIQSPALGAGHEVSHAAEHDRIGTEALVKNLEAPVVEVEMTPDGGMSVTYGVSPEEQRATAVEGKMAKELGEPIRSGYTKDEGDVITCGPTSKEEC